MDGLKLPDALPQERLFAALLAVLLVPLYIYCLPPVLPPYRDAGEMASVGWTLGVAHQPGYPLYIIASKLFSLLPMGNPAWRFNLFSAAAGLAGIFLFWRAASAVLSPAGAFFGALLLGFNFTLRTVSSVPEMYSLNFLFGAALLLSSFMGGRRAVFLSAFLLGLGMANRMDLLLAAPAVLLLLWPQLKEGGPLLFLKAVGFALLGFSLYLYLPLRSAGWPYFDWSHPADPATFLAVITRKSYGSTLDLISLNYAKGELFLPGLKYYAVHLWENFSLGLAVAAAGAWYEWRVSRLRLAAIGALFFFSGIVFIYMANMPPNPHALAVVEPYYLLPDLAVAFWAAAGFYHLSRARPRALPGLIIVSAVSVVLVFYSGAYGSHRRWLFAAEDYASDVMRSCPPGSSLVAKKDVQLFSLWYMQSVKGRRPDLNIVAQGLSGSPWYQNVKRRYSPGFPLANLNAGGEAEWRSFVAASGGAVCSTMDVELPASAKPRPHGIVSFPYSSASPAKSPWPLYSLSRLSPRYRDFFDEDLGVSYGQALLSGAARANSSGGLVEKDVSSLRLAAIYAPDLPDAPLYEGFYHSSRGDWKSAEKEFKASTEVYERILLLSREYRSLPDLRESLRKASAYAWLNYGVSLEKNGDRSGAERAYNVTLERNPLMADAHYNLAILYWNRDWNKVARELAATLRINPGHRQARQYLQQLRRR